MLLFSLGNGKVHPTPLCKEMSEMGPGFGDPFLQPESSTRQTLMWNYQDALPSVGPDMGPDNSPCSLDKAKHCSSAPPEELCNFMKWLLQSGVPTYAHRIKVLFPTTVVLLGIA